MKNCDKCVKTNKETRFLPVDQIEMRVESDSDGNSVLTGYAAVFNTDSVNLGGFIERVMPGAFKETLKSSDVRALFNHDTNMVLGRNTAGTLRMTENSKGLKFEVDLPDTQFARDVATSIKRGDITGSSFSFTTREDVWRTVDGQEIRELVEVDVLFDVGPVSFPAYPDTSVAARSLKSWLDTKDAQDKKEQKADPPVAETQKPPVEPDEKPDEQPAEKPDDVAADAPAEEPQENQTQPDEKQADEQESTPLQEEIEAKAVDQMAANREVLDKLKQGSKDIVRKNVDIMITRKLSGS